MIKFTCSNCNKSISIAPTANNTNANHFTYLGVMKLEPTADT